MIWLTMKDWNSCGLSVTMVLPIPLYNIYQHKIYSFLHQKGQLFNLLLVIILGESGSEPALSQSISNFDYFLSDFWKTAGFIWVESQGNILNNLYGSVIHHAIY